MTGGGALSIASGLATGGEVSVGKGLLKSGNNSKSARVINAENKLEKAAKGSSNSTGGIIVNSSGEAVVVPKGATPTEPNKGTGMVYQGGSGGTGMDKRTTGVRIMDPNSKQGRRVNYMNKDGQTVDPKTGKTISNDNPAGHKPYGK